MSTRTHYLAWRDKARTCQWFAVGVLDSDVKASRYRFRYIAGAQRAQKEAAFPLLLEFRVLDRAYESSDLFALFRNRIIAPRRPDRKEYLRNLGLDDDAEPLEILSLNGGTRVTDSYEVFPKLEKDSEGKFTCRFFLHSWQYMDQSMQEKIASLRPDEELSIALDLTNPIAQLRVQVQTKEYSMLGWTPQYVVGELAELTAKYPNSSNQISAKVVQVNPQSAPSEQRVLIELSGNMGDHEPMNGPDFKPLVD